MVGIDVRLAAPVWLAFHVEPGAVLRSVPFTTSATEGATIQGAWLGFGLALHFEPFAAADP